MARRRVLIIIAVGVAACVVALVFWGKGRRDIVLDGTLQWGFEESAFFPNGDCSIKPLWWEWPNNRDGDLDAKWKAWESQPRCASNCAGIFPRSDCMDT